MKATTTCAKADPNASKDGPVFLIGNGRSGSTLFFKLFITHREIGGITRNRIGRLAHCEETLPQVYLLSVLRRTSRDRAIPLRSEAYNFWSRLSGEDFHRSWLWSIRADTRRAERMRSAIARITRWQGKDRFATKLTGPGRIGYLKSVFPNAHFVHLIRNAEPQVSSILKAGFWKNCGAYEGLWWDRDIPPFLASYLAAAKATSDPIVLATAQWRAVIEAIRKEADTTLDAEDFVEIRYEELVTQPRKTILKLWNELGLTCDAHDLTLLDKYRVTKTRNVSLTAELSADERAHIREWQERPL